MSNFKIKNSFKIYNLKFKITLAILCILFSGIVTPVQAAPLVICGVGGNECENVCQVLEMGSGIINLLTFKIVPVAAGLLFLAAGFMMLFGGASPEMISKARGMITKTVIGVLLIYGAWLIANTVITTLAGDDNTAKEWYRLDCGEENGTGTGGGGGGGGSGGGGGGGGTWNPPPVVAGTFSDADARNYLLVRSNNQIDPGGIRACSNAVQSDCGSYQGVRQSTLDEIIRLQADCGCYIKINDATGPGHSGAGHYDGTKIDIQHSSTLDAKINSYPPDPGHPGDSRYRIGPTGAIYFYEDSAHWDILVS